MGCDIHLYTETRDDINTWSCADILTLNEDEGVQEVDYKDQLYTGRNYDLFAILANVRNGYGFAGVDTGDAYIPIDQPRGLPSDASEIVRRISDRCGDDAHSHSYLTVQEILDYDWTQTSTKRGYVSLSTYEKWCRWGKSRGENPDGWCGGVSGGGIIHMKPDEADKLLESATSFKDKEKIVEQNSSAYVHCEWKTPYYKQCCTFLSETMPRLWRLGDPEDVRIIFWFDN